MHGRIFLSYRRVDVPNDVYRIRKALVKTFGPNSVFMDSDSIRPGQRFDHELARALDACQILIAIIGPHWMRLLREHAKKRSRKITFARKLPSLLNVILL